MTDGPRYSWIVRDGDDEPWILLSYRWTDRTAAVEHAEHWLRCSRHSYAQVKTVEVVGDEWTVLPERPAPAPAPIRMERSAVGGMLADALRVTRPEPVYGTPVTPTVFLPMEPDPDPPPGLSRKSFARLREAMRREGLTP